MRPLKALAGEKSGQLLASVQWTGEPDDRDKARRNSDRELNVPPPPCTYLSIRRASGTSYAYASNEHRCFWGGHRLRISIEQQEEYCLPSRLAECPLALRILPRPVSAETAEPAKEQEPQRRRSHRRRSAEKPRPFWKRLLGKD